MNEHSRPLSFRLLAITDRHVGLPDIELLHELGGAVLFRDKDLPEEERLRRAAALRLETARANVPLLFHGNAQLAQEVGAD